MEYERGRDKSTGVYIRNPYEQNISAQINIKVNHNITINQLGMKFLHPLSPTWLTQTSVNRVLSRAISMHIHRRVIGVCLPTALMLLLLLWRRIAVLVASWSQVVVLQAPSNRARESIRKDRILDSWCGGSRWCRCYWQISYICSSLRVFICPVFKLML